MTYRALTIIALMLAMGTAAADDGGRRGDRGPDIDRLAIVLEMDDYQKQEVERIFTEHRETAKVKREEFRATGERPDRETIEAHHEEMRASLRAELETVLTAEQLEKLDALHEMRGDRRRGPPRHKHRRVDDNDEESS